MFRPFTGEVLVGKISGYDEKGLQGYSVIFSLIFGLQSLIAPFLKLALLFLLLRIFSLNF
jgi:hypothetical protein